MKAWILEAQDNIENKPLRLMEVPTPLPQEEEVRIQVLYCGVCRTDLHVAEGDLPLQKSPLVLGHEVVGVVDKLGSKVERFRVGDRVGAYWLNHTCGRCKYCRSGRENYCPDFRATGWHANGGFAEYMTISEAFACPLHDLPLDPPEIAPLLCPGIAGYAAFKLTSLRSGESLGLYGFGPTAYYVLKAAQSLDIQVYVSTRSQANQERAKQEGALWVADASKESMPVGLDAAILFPPAGDLVEPILSQITPGGTLVMAPVSSSPIRIRDYSANLWGRTIQTLYQVKRADAEEFIRLAGELDLHPGIRLFPFDRLDEALIRVKHGEVGQPNAVIEIAP